ncbi:MAG: DNA helicase RecQ [Bacteroidaceae bacterium]|nr:DNA helicase RecQ [Bacteroidaceae bacterium]
MKKKMTLQESLKYYFGFDTFKGDQEAIIKNLLKEKDTFVLMPTGGGKSLCYQLPALLMEGTAIVISPLIALMKNQVDAIKHISETDNVAHFINSSLNKASITQVKEDIMSGQTKLLYVAPESLTKQEYVDFLRTVKISFFAIDEAHCISEWGHDFRPEYRRIRPIIDEIGQAPIIALTATATDKVRIDIKKNLGMPDATEYKASFNRPNLFYEIRQKTKDIDKDIVKFIKANPNKSGIIYCLSRKKVEDLAKILTENDIKAAAYHAGMETNVRNATQDDFLMERIDVIVATIAFGMGIDKPDVRFVIHYDIPKSLEGYYQETGRAGRDGGEGRCIAFYTHKDIQKLEKFMEGKKVAEQEIGQQLLKETANYCESSVCRRKLILHYFGEEYKEDNCGCCDNCRNPKVKVDATKDLLLALKAIDAIKENFKIEYVIDVLRGNDTETILNHKHEQIDIFGMGKNHEFPYWSAVLNQAMLEGFLRKDVDNYGLLKITDKGRKFIKKQVKFMIVEDNEFDDVVVDDSMETLGTVDETLHKMLIDLRKKLSKKYDVPPYVIFQDPSIDAMTTYYPITLEELQNNIPGVGAGKAKRYGKEFVELIKRHVEENEIERPTDMRVRTVANKSLQKISIIQSIDLQKSLYDIAIAKGIEFDKLIEDIEAIVYSGTKLNIDYFIEEEIDEDKVDEIYDYFLESDTDDIDTALDNLSSDISEDEVRLVRVKFMSDLAN